MKYIVCNSETAVLNRMYDEFEKNLEDGAVICLPENIINTQFTNRMIDDNQTGKYRYKHVILLGQREFADIDIEEKFGLYRYARHELFKKLDLEAKNIYYPQALNSNECEEDLNSYKEVLEEKSQLQQAGMEIKGNKLISIGYENLMSARNLFVVVLGNDKRKYIAELFENEESENKTILSILNNHKNLFIFTDKEASYKSEEEVNRLIKQRQKKLEIKEREERLQNEEKKKDR